MREMHSGKQEKCTRQTQRERVQKCRQGRRRRDRRTFWGPIREMEPVQGSGFSFFSVEIKLDLMS